MDKTVEEIDQFISNNVSINVRGSCTYSIRVLPLPKESKCEHCHQIVFNQHIYKNVIDNTHKCDCCRKKW